MNENEIGIAGSVPEDLQLSPTGDEVTEENNKDITTEKPKREYAKADRILILIALIIGVTFERLVVSSDYVSALYFERASAVFWFVCLALFYAFNWEGIRTNKTLWVLSGFAILLCAWNFIFESARYMELTWLVIPAVLMAIAQIYAYQIKPKQVFKTAIAWITGFCLKPFSAIGHFFGAAASGFKGDKRPKVKNLILAVFISVLALCVIIPLLISADKVFEYYANQLMSSFNISRIISHILIIAVTTLLFYSFFWNARFGAKEKPNVYEYETLDKIKLERFVACFVISAVLAIYVLFCTVQFTYLFARAGLPAGMTYSEYAREGFSQIVMICMINLVLFGALLHFGEKNKAMTVLLTLLLAVTAVILVSGFVRLKLYIDAYGMTWLRLLSAWFIIYLAAALIICAVRLYKESLPAVFACALVLLVWYTALGYANPDALIDKYNETYGYDRVAYHQSAVMYELRSYPFL